ncbi:MAG: hypothetical protein N4A72_07575 [Bacteroidales bacterium]|jgi:hypothetical protein|nr:hypothetical protein [Bacteroidales bacterium]
MRTYLEGFKTDYLSTTFTLFSKTWKNILISTLLSSIAIMPFIMIFTFYVFADNLELLAELGNITNPNEQREFMQELLLDNSFVNTFKSSGFITWSVTLMLLVFIIWAWGSNFALISNKKVVKGIDNRFNDCFRESFNINVFKIFAVQILIIIAFFIALMITGFISGALSLPGIITFLLTLLVFIFMFKAILIIPAIVVGELSLGEAISYSFKNMSFLRCLKYTGYSIIVLIALIILSLVLAFIAIPLSMIPFIGVVFSFAFRVVVNASMSTLNYSAFAGMYLRYFNPEIPEIPTVDENKI